MKWRRLNEILKTRENDRDFKLQIEYDTVHTCKKHFANEYIEICKFSP